MFLDTNNLEGMNKSICKYLNITNEKLKYNFQIIRKNNNDDFKNENFNNLIDNSRNRIEKMMLFHLSRRLHSSINETVGKNLHMVLTSNNSITKFLRNYNITFINENEYIRILYHTKKVILENDKDNILARRLMMKLGQDIEYKDYCINGFAFADKIEKNEYIEVIGDAPEFIKELSKYLNIPDLITDYRKNSELYCYSYCIPINDIIFDDNDELNTISKQKEIAKAVLEKIYQYSFGLNNYTYDYNNIILRLDDRDYISEKYYISRKKIITNV